MTTGSSRYIHAQKFTDNSTRLRYSRLTSLRTLKERCRIANLFLAFHNQLEVLFALHVAAWPRQIASPSQGGQFRDMHEVIRTEER
jgi:hypothetical protein